MNWNVGFIQNFWLIAVYWKLFTSIKHLADNGISLLVLMIYCKIITGRLQKIEQFKGKNLSFGGQQCDALGSDCVQIFPVSFRTSKVGLALQKFFYLKCIYTKYYISISYMFLLPFKEIIVLPLAVSLSSLNPEDSIIEGYHLLFKSKILLLDNTII